MRLEAKNVELGSLLEEAARSDRLVAEEKLHDGKDAEAPAHLARGGPLRAEILRGQDRPALAGITGRCPSTGLVR
jgi:hypothetical protein